MINDLSDSDLKPIKFQPLVMLQSLGAKNWTVPPHYHACRHIHTHTYNSLSSTVMDIQSSTPSEWPLNSLIGFLSFRLSQRVIPAPKCPLPLEPAANCCLDDEIAQQVCKSNMQPSLNRKGLCYRHWSENTAMSVIFRDWQTITLLAMVTVLYIQCMLVHTISSTLLMLPYTAKSKATNAEVENIHS